MTAENPGNLLTNIAIVKCSHASHFGEEAYEPTKYRIQKTLKPLTLSWYTFCLQMHASIMATLKSVSAQAHNNELGWSQMKMDRSTKWNKIGR